MTKIIDLEKIFSHVSRGLKEDRDLIKQEFLAEIRILAEKWIENKYIEMKE